MELIVGRGLRFASILGTNPPFIAKSFPKSVRCIPCTDSRFWKSQLAEKYPRCRTLTYNYAPLLNHFTTYQKPFKHNINKNGMVLSRYCTSKQTPKEDGNESPAEPEKNVSVFKKMKQMGQDYWHILVPVHVVTSIGWITVFYVAVKNGVDIVGIMEYLNFSEKYLEMFRNSSAGNWVLAYTLYKIFTPLRYAVTVGSTTMTVRHLKKLGLNLKPPKIPILQGLKKRLGSTTSTEATKTNCKAQKSDSPKT